MTRDKVFYTSTGKEEDFFCGKKDDYRQKCSFVDAEQLFLESV